MVFDLFIRRFDAGDHSGVYHKLDRENDDLVADLLCYCHPRLVIEPIAADTYYQIRKEVFQKPAA